jgi:hypothetical protein
VIVANMVSDPLQVIDYVDLSADACRGNILPVMLNELVWLE